MREADPVLALLGLATRAGAVVPGTARVREAVAAGTLGYVVVAADASANAQDKLLPLLERRAVPHVVRYERATLGGAVGKAGLSAVGIADRGFAVKLEDLIGRTSDAVGVGGSGERGSAEGRPVRSRRQP
jgi:ribosomal protein L7Ae-like RNA K-turn-binding protein